MVSEDTPMQFPAADSDFSRSYFYCAFHPCDAFPYMLRASSPPEPESIGNFRTQGIGRRCTGPLQCPFQSTTTTFPDLIFNMLFAPALPSLTCSERLASQDLQEAEIFEPGELVDGARGRSDAVSSRRRRLFFPISFSSCILPLCRLPLHVVCV